MRLRYRSVTQYQDYRALPLEQVGATDVYLATVPAEHVDPAWDFMYLLEVVDKHGNGAIYPDLEITAPYIIVKLIR